MSIAVFGGSFNPVHRGHYEIVCQIFKHRQIEQIIVVPTYQNPLKTSRPIIPDQLRFEMLEATFSDLKKVTISDFELKNPQPSFTYLTLQHFKKQYNQDQFYLIMGEDAFSSFHKWAEIDTLLQSAKLMIFYRPALRKNRPESLPYNLQGKVEWIELEIPNISASQIRCSDIATVEKNAWLHPQALKIWQHHRKNMS